MVEGPERRQRVEDPDKKHGIEACHFCHIKMLPTHALHFRVQVTALDGKDRDDLVFMVTTCRKCKSRVAPRETAYAARKLPDEETATGGLMPAT